MVDYFMAIFRKVNSGMGRQRAKEVAVYFLESKGVSILIKLVAEKYILEAQPLERCLELLLTMAVLNNDATKVMNDYLFYIHAKKILNARPEKSIKTICECLLGFMLNSMTKQDKRSKRVLKTLTFYYMLDGKVHICSYYKNVIALNND